MTALCGGSLLVAVAIGTAWLRFRSDLPSMPRFDLVVVPLVSMAAGGLLGLVALLVIGGAAMECHS